MPRDRYNISNGAIEVSYPMPMTHEDVQDFKDAMAILFRVLERTAINGHPTIEPWGITCTNPGTKEAIPAPQ